MKLIPLIILTTVLAVDCRAHEQFSFSPQFSTPHAIFSQDKSPYLPPESHTPIPYFAMKNFNLPFQYLPPTATRAPVPYPPTHPIVISSTYKPKQNDDDDDKEDEKYSSPHTPFYRNAMNRSDGHQQQKPERRELRPVPKSFQLPIDRIDTKFPIQFSANTETAPEKEKTISRSIVIGDLQRRDSAFDQAKASSFQSAQYIPQNIFVSSTTETSIPILRLSNEMDLDGSFSYEALGADQTHYVQHSRMENMGEGKEEQIVEGSYSYVGDNGKTYTVHYIADSNGFRAIGDHLPVAPPIPEIIQRSIQYNLAEEAKKPPSLKSWNDEHNENIVSESERRNQFAITPPRINPLFTGKTPQSFSHSFSDNSQHNMITSASTQNPMVATIDFTSDQMQSKQNSGTISPQITFLASQGAHVPSANTPQQTIVRMFTTEKSTMPQLINYETNIKESDQEGNKALWRWQYGINANANQNVDKTSISRSFGEDDVSINFGDMTQEQYTKMFNQEVNQNQRLVENSNDFDHHRYVNSNSNDLPYSQDIMDNTKSFVSTETNQYSPDKTTSSEAPTTSKTVESAPSTYNSYVPSMIDVPNQKQINENIRAKLITQKQFIPPHQIVTQMYDYVDNEFDSRKSKIMASELDNNNEVNLNVMPLHFDNNKQNHFKAGSIQQVEESIGKTTTSPPITKSTVSGEIKFSDFIVNENKDGFKPLFAFEPEIKETTTTTTENSIENMFTENIFLKNMLRANDNNKNDHKKLQEENSQLLVKPEGLKVVTHLNNHQPKSLNNMKVLERKPIDVAEVLNFMTKNHQFESSKIKSRPKQIPVNYNVNYDDSYYEPENEENYDEEREHRNFRTLHDQEELRGVIKNYKILQRNHNVDRNERDNIVNRFKNSLRSHSVKPYNLPPLGRAGPATKTYLPPVYV